MHYVMDKNGVVIEEPEPLAFAKWFETADRQIAENYLTEQEVEVRVSTVFLGIDHNPQSAYDIKDNTDPVLFETMIFGGEHDEYQERYCTRKDALLGHGRALNLVKNCK